MLKIAVIGDPIEHSLSPIVHGAALSALGIDYEYERTRVKKGGLSDYIEYAKKNGICGFNLTMPHKVDVIPYLSEVDESGCVFDSVNTVCIKDSRLYGYNTDGVGYKLSLKRCGYTFDKSRVVILGAGGVVRTLAITAAMEGAESICILNRTKSRGEEVCEIVAQKTNIKIDCGNFLTSELEKRCSSADIVINATPLGMGGIDEDFASFDFLDGISKGALVSDLIYNPYETSLLKEAKIRGLKTQNGLGMLIYQALVADEYYLGQKIDMEEIYDSVEQAARCEMNI